MPKKIHPEGFLKLADIIGDKEGDIPTLIPVSRSLWLEGVASGLYPAPVKISKRRIAWRGSDILELIEKINDGSLFLNK